MHETKRVIINGDDWGYSKSATSGIVEAYKNGILTSTTALANALGGNESVPQTDIYIPKPSLGIGVHLNLTRGEPLVPTAWGIRAFTRPYKGTNQPQEWQGSTWQEYFSHFSREQILEEFRAQIQRAIDVFGSVDHLDSHQGVASYMPVQEVYEELAREFDLPVRHISPLSEIPVYAGNFVVDSTYPQAVRSKGIKTVDRVDMEYFHRRQNPVDAFCRELEKVRDGEVVEFMFHPAIDDSDGAWKVTDLQILTSEQTIKVIQDFGIQLTTYRSAY